MEAGEIRLITIDLQPPPGQSDLVSCKLEQFPLKDEHYSEAYKKWVKELGRPLQPSDRWLWRSQIGAPGTASGQPGAATRDGTETIESPLFRFTWGDYFALSYVWGSKVETATIIVNGEDFTVTKNLEAALHALRNYPLIKRGFKIWVDAIGINQADLRERGRQVRRMQEIYGRSLDVITWLGASGDESEMAADFINSLSGCWGEQTQDRLKQTLAEQLDNYGPKVWDALCNLCKRPYWSRLWVVQELVMGTDRKPVLCGDREIRWDDLFNALWYFHAPQDDTTAASVREVLDSKPDHAAALRRLLEVEYWHFHEIIEVDWMRKQLPAPETMALMTYSRRRDAADPRDMIYGLLGIMDRSLAANVQADYTAEVREIYTAFSQNWIETTNSLDVLGQCDFKDTPSWVFHPDRARYRHLHSALEPPYHAGDTSKAEVRFDTERARIACKGLLIGAVDGLSTYIVHVNFSGEGTGREQLFPSQGHQNGYGTDAALHEALWRTLVGNRDLVGNTAPAAYTAILHSMRLGVREVADWIAANRGFTVAGRPLEACFAAAGAAAGSDVDESALGDAVIRASRFGFSRRLMTSSNGLLGMVAESAQPGDAIAVLFGCSLPVLLRRVEGDAAECYRLVGPCYVHGIMEGETVRGMKTGSSKYEVNEFVIA